MRGTLSALAFVLGSLWLAVLLACQAPAAPAPPPATPTKAPAVAPAATPTKAPEPAKPAAPAPQIRMIMGTTQQASSHYPYLVTASKIINGKVPEVNITVRETGGSSENADLWVKGDIQISLLSTDMGYLLYNGLEKYQGRGREDIRYLWVYTVNPHVYMVRRDSPVTKLEDLEGKDYHPAARGSSSELQTKRVFEVLGIKPKLYIGGTDDAIAAIKDRRIHGYTKAMIGYQLDASIIDLMTATPIRLLTFTKGQLDKFLEAYPYYGYTAIPAGTFKDVEENKVPLLYPTLTTAVATSAKIVPPEVAYKITKAIVEDNKPGGDGLQAAAMAIMKTIDIPKVTVEQATVPLHAGAYKYLKEIGMTIPQKLMPPEVK